MYKNSQQVREAGCSLKYRQNSNKSTYRLAVVVSKKVSKSAVVRNRIRRRIYEVVRSLEEAIKVPKDMVLTVHESEFETMESAKLKATVSSLFKKAGIT